MRDRLNAAMSGAKPSVIREFSALAAATPGCVKLTLGEPEFATPRPVVRAAEAALEAGETHYIPNNGDPALLRRIAQHEAQRHGLVYAPEEIIVTAGATEALFVALFGILNPGDEVILPRPAFVLYEEIIRLCRGVPVFLDTTADGFQIRRERLNALVTPRTKAVILNSPNNPTGCVYHRESLAAVRDLAAERWLFLLCDEVYRDLVYTADCPGGEAFTDKREQLLIVQSFSKPYAMTGWRMGYLMADASVKERLALLHQFMVVSTPAPFQRAGMAALDWDMTPMRETYRRRRDYALSRLRDMGMAVTEPEGAFYLFPAITAWGLDSVTFCTRMIREAGVAATPGVCFGGEGHIRLSYACADETLREGLDRLQGFLRRL